MNTINIIDSEIIIFTHVNGKQFPIIKNPTTKDYEFIKARFQELCPFCPKGEPFCRFTYDNLGGEYIWCSDDSMHWLVEDFLNKKFNVITNQNKDFD